MEIEPFPRPGPSTERVSSSRCHRRTTEHRGRRTEISVVRRLPPSKLVCVGQASKLSREPPIRPAISVVRSPLGGARRDRTDDLMLAKHALSQLSYGPVRGQRTENGYRSLYSALCPPNLVGLGGLEPPTSRLSSARSNQLSYKPAPEDRKQRTENRKQPSVLCRPSSDV